MTIFKLIFWFSFLVVFYSYIGYGILLYFLVHVKKWLFHSKGKRAGMGAFEPPVTLIVSAYNEEDFIQRKIENTLALDYPKEKLKLIFITDGSTDATPKIVRRCPEIQLLHEAPRMGKIAGDEPGDEIRGYSMCRIF